MQKTIILMYKQKNRKKKKNDRSKILPFRIFFKLKLKKLITFKIMFSKYGTFFCFLARLGAKEFFCRPNGILNFTEGVVFMF